MSDSEEYLLSVALTIADHSFVFTSRPQRGVDNSTSIPSDRYDSDLPSGIIENDDFTDGSWIGG